jgi:tripartite ATP-independent transporter DctP family solute receptor
MMKKALIGFCICLGMSGLASGTASAADVKTYEFNFGHIQNPGHDLYVAIENFAKLVGERSNGAVKIKVFPSSQLGTEREMIEQSVMGTLDIMISDPAGWSTGLELPELGVFGLPFMYNTLETQKKIIDNVVLAEFQKRSIPKGVHPMFVYSNGIRHVITKNKPIVNMDDIKGLKMRCPENPLFVGTWRALGANTVTTPWSEVYTALSQGVCDAAEADSVGLVNTNLHEVGKYLSHTGHMGGLYITSMNEKKWQTLPKEIQDIFLQVGAESSADQIANRKKSDDVAEKTMADKGVKIIEISAAERAKMRQAVEPLYQEYAQKYGMGELIEKLLELAK